MFVVWVSPGPTQRQPYDLLVQLPQMQFSSKDGQSHHCAHRPCIHCPNYAPGCPSSWDSAGHTPLMLVPRHHGRRMCAFVAHATASPTSRPDDSRANWMGFRE